MFYQAKPQPSVHVQSISSRIAELILAPGLTATVNSAFAEACNLTTPEGTIFSLVSPKLGNGPLSVVVAPAEILAVLQKDDDVHGDGRWLWLGQGWRLDIASANLWDPHPDLSLFIRWPQVVYSNLTWLRSAVPAAAPPQSLASHPAFDPSGAFGGAPANAVVRANAGRWISGLVSAYQQGSVRWIGVYARRMAGLGPGLTPAGDDWLAGWLLGLRVKLATDGEDSSPVPLQVVADTVLDAAQGRTNALSLAFLEAAVDGAVPQAWHQFLASLTSAEPTPLREATSEIMRHGGTSGADMLAGFLAAFQED